MTATARKFASLRCGPRFGAVLAAVLLSWLVLAPSASAHARLVSMSPAAGSSVPSSPASVVLTFDEAVSQQFATITVTDVGGGSVTQGPTAVDGAKVSQSLQHGLAPGIYTVSYRVVSDDGHPVSARVAYRVSGAPDRTATPGASASAPRAATAPSTPSPTALASKAAAAGQPVGFWGSGHLWGLVAVAACLLVGIALLVRQRRSSAQ